ncbi:MAG: type I methionyl aminopeptidase [Defluviitaleaceae bacterium]|nr:type I methionyl aminopeptidase [Defluviitaleaceae bacterium]
MAIVIKNQLQIEKMRKAGVLVKGAFDLLAGAIAEGVTTRELDGIVAGYFKSQGATASFKGYRGYPASICASINDEVIHGIPGTRRLRAGDIVSIDIGACFDGFHGDAARTFCVGDVSDEARRLADTTEKSFFAGMQYARAGYFLHEISAAIQEYVEQQGFSVVRNFIGHGIGADLHEDPEIPNYRQKNKGPRLVPGMTLAIEPMVNAGTYEVEVLEDDWTVVTADGSLSAHYENTVLITEGAPEILTL